MKILALIPARGGSKRLPGKNMRSLGGKPLINWTIEAAQSVPEVCEILVSTDDSDIALIAKQAGASVPWLRPKDLATDQATSVDVVLHALDWYETESGSVDGVLLLQPTSPFRTSATIKQGIELFRKHDRKSVVGVSAVQDHPMWTFKVERGYLVPFIGKEGFGIRSQDLEPAYIVTGGFYLTTPGDFRNRASFIGSESIPLFITSLKEKIDIDTEDDFKFAEFLISESQQVSNNVSHIE
jgi:CMP-N,N'-diacetyllegionaminic acid synthase